MQERVDFTDIADQKTPWLSRWLALWALRVLTAAGFALLPAVVLLLFFTARCCARLLHGGSTRLDKLTWLDGWEPSFRTLAQLDVSGCSALIALLVCLFLCGRGVRHGFLLPWGHGKDFWHRAFPLRLFPMELPQFTVRVGLIGTLTAFVFAALVHLDVKAGAKTGASAAALWAARSQEVFGFLTAALVPTLAGALAAYVALPFLAWVNAAALAHRHLRREEPASPADRAGEALDAVVRRFEQAADSLVAGVEGLGARFVRANEEVSGAVAVLCRALDEATIRLGEISRLIDCGRELADACKEMPGLSRQAQDLVGALAAVRGESASAVEALKEAGAVARVLAGQLEKAAARRDALLQLQQAQADLARAAASVALLSQGVDLAGAGENAEETPAPAGGRLGWLWGKRNGSSHAKEGS
jgi:hypothetical protein